MEGVAVLRERCTGIRSRPPFATVEPPPVWAGSRALLPPSARAAPQLPVMGQVDLLLYWDLKNVFGDESF